MADGNVIGEAVIEIRAGMDKLRADVEAMKPVIQKVADEQEKVANNTEKTAQAAGGWAASLVGVWNTWNSITNTMQSALALGEQIGNVLVTNTARAQQFANSLAGGTGRGAAISSQQRQSELQLQLGDLEQGGFLGGFLAGIDPFHDSKVRKVRAELEVLQSGDEANRIKALRELNSPYLNADFSSASDVGIGGASAAGGFGGDAVSLLREIRNTARWNPPSR